MKNTEFPELLAIASSISNPYERLIFLLEEAKKFKQFVTYQNDFLKQVEIEIEFTEKKQELLLLISNKDDVFEKNKNNLKVATYFLIELLNLLQKGTSHNDFTALADLIAILIGYSPKNILNIIQKGIHFSKQHHGAVIEQLNKASKRASIPIFIRI